MMEIAGEHRFAASRDIVFDALLDPGALQASMPGCERFDETGPEQYAITLKVGIAAIKGTYEGTIAVTDRQPRESFRLDVVGAGKPGKVLGNATMTLSDDGDGTLVKYSGDVRAQGAIARLGNRLLGGAAKMMIGQFFKEMDGQVKSRTAR